MALLRPRSAVSMDGLDAPRPVVCCAKDAAARSGQNASASDRTSEQWAVIAAAAARATRPLSRSLPRRRLHMAQAGMGGWTGGSLMRPRPRYAPSSPPHTLLTGRGRRARRQVREEKASWTRVRCRVDVLDRRGRTSVVSDCCYVAARCYLRRHPSHSTSVRLSKTNGGNARRPWASSGCQPSRTPRQKTVLASAGCGNGDVSNPSTVCPEDPSCSADGTLFLNRTRTFLLHNGSAARTATGCRCRRRSMHRRCPSPHFFTRSTQC